MLSKTLAVAIIDHVAIIFYDCSQQNPCNRYGVHYASPRITFSLLGKVQGGILIAKHVKDISCL